MDTTFGNGGTVTTDFAGIDNASRILIIGAKILVAGAASLETSDPSLAIARYNSDGSLDSTFGSGGKLIVPHASASAIFLQTDYDSQVVKILVVTPSKLMRFNADGTVDATFGTNGQVSAAVESQVDAVMQPDGRIVVAGSAAVARYNPDGTLDTSFGGAGVVPVLNLQGGGYFAETVALGPDGKIVIAGGYNAHPALGMLLTRLNADGTLDVSFGTSGLVQIAPPTISNEDAVQVAVQPDGKTVVLAADTAVYRLLKDGGLDLAFGNAGRFAPLLPPNAPFVAPAAPGGGILVQGDGKILISTSLPGNGSEDFALERILGNAPLNERYVTFLYQELLHRAPDPAGLAFWTAQFDRQLPRNVLTTAFTQSTEYRTVLVTSFYVSYLQRQPDAQGLQAFVNLLGSGATIEQVKAQFLGSDEFFRNNAETNDRYLDLLYRNVLGRPLDASGRQTFGQALANGASRASVALSVLTSREADEGLLGALYFQYLHRSPDSSGLDAFATALQRGMRSEAVIAALTASDEYFGRVGIQ